MNDNKVHSQRTMYFSWENNSRVILDDDQYHKNGDGDDDDDFTLIKLSSPPCSPGKSRASFHDHDLRIPPPPCPNFQHSLRSSSSRRSFSFRKNIDDPFLMAYKECTKSRDKGTGLGLKKNLSVFSCKHSSNVIDDSIVRISQLPIPKSLRGVLKI